MSSEEEIVDLHETVEMEDSKDSPDMFGDSQEFMDIDIDAEVLAQCSSSKKETNSKSWRGASMAEIYNGDSPWNAPEFPPIIPAYNHAVLYHVPKSPTVRQKNMQPPIPQHGKEVWDDHHVRMPYSPQSLYPITEEDGTTILKKRWDIITEALSQPIKNSYELEKAILKYNSKYANQWKFSGLHKLFNQCLDEEESEFFFESTLPAMLQLALKLPQLIPTSIPFLRQHHNRSISLSQQQISCLLVNAFFCTFPRRNTNRRKSATVSYPEINFSRLFQHGKSQRAIEKLKCFFNYFRRVCKNVPCGVVTIMRRTIEVSKCPEWSESNHLIGSVPLHISSKGTIENEGMGLMQVDFANKYLGGGVLGLGCVQEEIRFVICPELIVSMLFTESMKPTEAVLIIGCERFNDYTGYADNFEWSGNHIDLTPLDSSGRRRCSIIAIDALAFRNPSYQYKPELILRELNKAWVGYSACSVELKKLTLNLPGVATGNWGCGAFCGSPYLKALVQLMACCQASRPIVYYTFDNDKLMEDVINMYNFLSHQNITVGELYQYLCEFHKSSASESQLYPFLLQHHKDVQKTKRSDGTSLLSTPKVQDKVRTNSLIDVTPKPIATNIPNKNFYGNSSAKKPCDGVVIRNSPSTTAREDRQARLPAEEDDNCDNTAAEKTEPKKSLFSEIKSIDTGSSNSQYDPEKSMLKKNISLSYFETQDDHSDKVSRMSDSHPVISDNVTSKATTADAQAKKKVPSGKISDYFQRLQKK